MTGPGGVDLVGLIDGRCGCQACEERTQGVYQMVGSCSNCCAGPFLLIYRAGDRSAAQDCPTCRNYGTVRGSCSLCGNLGVLDAHGERLHCDCRADDWTEGDNGAIRCNNCGGYAGEPGTSLPGVRGVSRG